MDTNYNEFNYQNDFQYNYNIFKNNYNIGIGTSIPKHNLEIHGNLSSSNNINIDGSLLLNKNNSNNLILLEYNVNTNQVSPLKLINQSNTLNNNKYSWIHDTTNNNNNLKLEFHNKNDNTIIPFQSVPYKLNEPIILYSKYNITLTNVFIYKSSNNNSILPSNLNITLNSHTLTKINDFYYNISEDISLNKNSENLISISSQSNIINLPNNINVTVDTDVYLFNGFNFDNNDYTFNISNGTYRLNNIPYDSKLAILNNTDITINEQNSSYNNSIVSNINTVIDGDNLIGIGTFYFNDIKFHFDSIFYDDISIISIDENIGIGTNIFRCKKTDNQYDYLPNINTSISDITSQNSETINVSVNNSLHTVSGSGKYLLNINDKYKFQRLSSDIVSHPFYVSIHDNWNKSQVTPSNIITLTGNGTYSNQGGIINNQNFILEFNINNTTYIDKLYYYCTNHNMFDYFELIDTTETINIYVSVGQLVTPYYILYTDSNGTIELEKNSSTDKYILDINKKYNFRRLSNTIVSHPFYISTYDNWNDARSNSSDSNIITFTGDGTYSDQGGIKNDDNFTLEFNISDTTQTNKLYYYCTNHNMFDYFELIDTTINIYVSSGQLGTPYYTLYTNLSGTIELEKNASKYILNINKKYKFQRLSSDIVSHPFYVSIHDNWNKAQTTPSNVISITGDGTYSDQGGIKNDDDFILEFNINNTTYIDKLYYYCTNHNMFDYFDLTDIKETINIYVSAGQNVTPYYILYTDSNGTIELEKNLSTYRYILNINKKYNFQRVSSNIVSHPFYISTHDNWSDAKDNSSDSNIITLTGDGTHSAEGGIKNDDNFTLEFNINDTTQTNKLYYYCTNHNMFDYFELTDNTIIYVSEGQQEIPYYTFYIDSNISNNNYIFNFNDNNYSLNDNLKFYLLQNKQYIFKNIPDNHPISFIDSTNNQTTSIHVMYHDTGKKQTENNINFYSGNISFLVNSSFVNNDISIKCKNHSYMGIDNIFIHKEDRILLPSSFIILNIENNFYNFSFGGNSYSFGDYNFHIQRGKQYTLVFNNINFSLQPTTDLTIIENTVSSITFLVKTDATLLTNISINPDTTNSPIQAGTNKIQIIDDIDELPNNGSVNIIDITTNTTNSQIYYSFNDISLNTIDKYYVNTNDYYTLINIPSNYDLGFLNSDNITIYNDNTPVLHNNIYYYSSSITFKINNSFLEDISISSRNNSYMGGKYLLRSQDYTNISDLPTDITISITNNTYNFNNIPITNKKYYITQNTIYTFTNISENQSLAILSDNIIYSKYYYTRLVNSINYNYYYGTLEFTLNNTLDSGNYISIDSLNTAIGTNSDTLIYNDDLFINYIILLGKYNFNSGLLWNNNKDEDLLFINNNVGIGTTNIFNTQLYINDSAISTNTHVYNKIHSYNSEINTVNTNHSRINQITSNELTINKTNNNLGIGTNKTNDFLNIGNDLVISHNRNTYVNNISFLNNINFKNNINILYKNKPFIIFNNNNNQFSYKLNNIEKSTNKLFILNNVNVNPINNNYLNNNGNILNIYGNLNVTENVSVQGSLKINNQKNIFIQKKINVINFKNNTQLFNKGFTYAKYITTPNSKTQYLKVPYKSNTSEQGVLYYDNVNDTFIGNDGNNIKFLSEDQINSRKTTFDYQFNGLTQLLYTNSRHVNTNNINVTKQFILPKTDTFTKSNLDRTLVGNMRFNINTLYTQIHDGYKWCSIKYNNTESQLNYLSFDNLSDLQPSFHNRKLNYEYTSFVKPTFLTLSINPYSVLNVIFKSSNFIVNQTTINNTNPTHLSQNIDITNDVLGDFNLIELNSTKNNNVINYTCSFSFISNQFENFIAKYEFFNIKTTSESHNVFKLVSSVVPTNLVYNNMFQPNLTNIQLISGQNVYTDDSLYRDDLENIFYDRSDKTLNRNYHNKLYNLNYTAQTKFKLVFIKNLIHNKIKLFENDLLNTLSNVVYNEESEQLTKIEYSMEYNIVYHNDLFIKSFSSVILNTPIVNSNNKFNYRIIDSNREIKYDYKELFEEDLINTDYNTTSYEIYYDATDDTFYMEHISNSHKFTIIGHVDSVVVGLEYLTCQFKQFVSS